MKIVIPELWYCAFWILFGSAFLTALYWVIKWAIIAARAHP
jgi:hypothetical protein